MSEKIKLAICIPSSGMCKTSFASSLAGLVGAATSMSFWPQVQSFEVSVFVHESSVIHGNREALVKMALEWEATHILFIDDDMTFPAEAVRLLFSRRHPIVITNYPKRGIPVTPTAVSIDGKRYIEMKQTSTGIEEAWYGGFGLALIEAEVFKKVGAPWFMPRWDEESGGYTTEDLPFYEKARAAGYKCWVDHDASKYLGHVGNHLFTWEMIGVKPNGK